MALPININDFLNGKTVEWERLEFNEGWNPEAVLHTLCAFANYIHNLGGGYILIGVAENNGRPVLPPVGRNLAQIDAIQKVLLNLRFSAIAPYYHPIAVPVEIAGRLRIEARVEARVGGRMALPARVAGRVDPSTNHGGHRPRPPGAFANCSGARPQVCFWRRQASHCRSHGGWLDRIYPPGKAQQSSAKISLVAWRNGGN